MCVGGPGGGWESDTSGASDLDEGHRVGGGLPVNIFLMSGMQSGAGVDFYFPFHSFNFNFNRFSFWGG